LHRQIPQNKCGVLFERSEFAQTRKTAAFTGSSAIGMTFSLVRF